MCVSVIYTSEIHESPSLKLFFFFSQVNVQRVYSSGRREQIDLTLLLSRKEKAREEERQETGEQETREEQEKEKEKEKEECIHRGRRVEEVIFTFKWSLFSCEDEQSREE